MGLRFGAKNSKGQPLQHLILMDYASSRSKTDPLIPSMEPSIYLSLCCSPKHNVLLKIIQLCHVEVVQWTLVSITGLYPKQSDGSGIFFFLLPL